MHCFPNRIIPLAIVWCCNLRSNKTAPGHHTSFSAFDRWHLTQRSGVMNQSFPILIYQSIIPLFSLWLSNCSFLMAHKNLFQTHHFKPALPFTTETETCSQQLIIKVCLKPLSDVALGFVRPLPVSECLQRKWYQLPPQPSLQSCYRKDQNIQCYEGLSPPLLTAFLQHFCSIIQLNSSPQGYNIVFSLVFFLVGVRGIFLFNHLLFNTYFCTISSY